MKARRILKGAAGAAGVLVVAVGVAVVATDRRVAGPLHAVATGHVAPDLTDPGMIRRGAVHYDLVCAACHASPAEPLRGAALTLAPPAPVLHRRLGDWPPSLLFRRVRDGVTNSGMPAWPAPAREDEVWAMVAFLRVLPGLSAADYAALSGRDRPGPAGSAGTCARCHSAPDATAPRLDIQSPAYLADALHAYRGAARASGFMEPQVARLDDAAIARLAAELGRRDTGRAPAPGGPVPPIAAHGAPDRQIAACNACHDPAGPARAAFPALAGQHAGYLATQLALFADDAPHGAAERGGGPFVGLMQRAARGLTAAEIAELAEYYAGLP
jgi:cytochrome c553